jgi:predicted HTH transcriptional regulator
MLGTYIVDSIIADMFARMDNVERIGTGIRRMRDAMKNAGIVYPKIKSDVFSKLLLCGQRIA